MPEKFCLRVFPKILLILLLVAGIPLACLWYISLYQMQVHWRTHVDLHVSRTAEMLKDKVDAWLAMNFCILHASAALDDIISMNPARQNPVLQHMDDTFAWTYLVFTTRPDGMNVGRSDHQPLKDYSDRQYVQQIASGKPTGYEVLISKTTGKPALAMSVPIVDTHRHVVGVLAMASTLVEVSKAITDVRLGTTGFAMLLDRDGKVIAHGEPQWVTEQVRDGRHHPLVTHGVEGETVIYEEQGKRMIGYLRHIRHGWSILVQQEYDDAFCALHTAERDALVLLAMTLLLVMGVAIVSAWHLSGPLQRLANVADAMSQGKLSLATPLEEIQRKDEIGVLARVVERLSISLKMCLERQE